MWVLKAPPRRCSPSDGHDNSNEEMESAADAVRTLPARAASRSGASTVSAAHPFLLLHPSLYDIARESLFMLYPLSTSRPEIIGFCDMLCPYSLQIMTGFLRRYLRNLMLRAQHLALQQLILHCSRTDAPRFSDWSHQRATL